MNLSESLKLFNLNGFELKTNEEALKIIKKRYKILARKYHPDKSSGSDEMMTNVNRAYETLVKNYNREPLFDEIFFGEQLFHNPFEGVPIGFVVQSNGFFSGAEEHIRKINQVNNILKSFIGIFKNEPTADFSKITEIKEIIITPKEYFTGTKIDNLEIPKLYNLNIPLDNVFIKIDNPEYYYNKDCIHIRYPIGKINVPFVDPFGNEHIIKAPKYIKLKPGDGYKIQIEGSRAILVFV
jgi:hypothetical protein